MKRHTDPLWLAVLLLLVLIVSAGALSARTRLATDNKAFLPLVLGEPGSVPSGDLLVYGSVYERIMGPLTTIEGATVWITSCVDDWTTQTSTLADGSYVLIVPEAYISPCDTLVLGAQADGWQSRSATLYVTDLFAMPHRDIGLVRQTTPTPKPTTTPNPTLPAP